MVRLAQGFATDMNKIGFDSEKWLREQKQYILERVNASDGRLYIEVGGKLLHDRHAARVLPGYDENNKMKIFESLKDHLDIIICIYAGDIEQRKMRGDFGISYDADVIKMIHDFAEYGITCNKVLITRYENQIAANQFKRKLEQRGIKVWTHTATPGYPGDIDVVVSDEGYGKNPYIPVDAPVVIVAAPGPGSGKLATCLSQMYHESKMGITSNYAKFETFPIWNLPLNHPVNLAYEAATLDIGDSNLIDHFHLEAYGQVTTNYTRDLEAYPLLKRILEKLTGKPCAYKSPTDMGVNRCGFGIFDDEVCRKAANQEIIRRVFHTKVDYLQGVCSKDVYNRALALLDKAGLEETDRKTVIPARKALEEAIALKKGKTDGIACTAAMELEDGRIITAHNSDLMHAGAALVLNAVKALLHIDQSKEIIHKEIIESITVLKRDILSSKGVSLNVDEILIALSMSSNYNEMNKAACQALKRLNGCDVHFSHIPSAGDIDGLRKLGINYTSEPQYPGRNIE